MHLPLPVTKEETYQLVMDLIERSGQPNVALRFVMTGGYSPDSISISKPNLLIMSEDVHPAPAKQFADGISVIMDDYVREMAEVKSTDYKRLILLADAIKAAGAQDVLFQKNGEISELSRSNFFIIKGERLITPDRHILRGITRRTVLQLAQADFQIEERPVLLSELYDADEAFTTSSTKKVMPIVQVGDLTVADGKPGPKTAYLLGRFNDLIASW
jgi:branched-chain amino acid aminotransferase